MQINVRFLENLRIEASFDDFKVVADQPIRYKGDGSAPSPFDYFLASSALCAAYFVKVYCVSRSIPTDDIKITQQNILDPDNRYNQTLCLEIELPQSISEHDRDNILKAMDRCSVKRVIQNNPTFKITSREGLKKESGLFFQEFIKTEEQTLIPGKDLSLEETLLKMSKLIEDIGVKLEISSWRNPVPHVWSVHVRDAESPLCFSNGKGTTKLSALCSALGEYLERLLTNYFYSDFYLGDEISSLPFVHYPDEKWFVSSDDHSFPTDLMDDYLLHHYHLDGELKLHHLIDTNSGNKNRGVCALPFVRQSDQKTVYIPVNLIANLFVSNGMSAGNTLFEARVQALSEIFERAIKNEIIRDEISLPDVPEEVLQRFPKIWEGIKSLEEKGFGVLVKDASLGGKYPVMNVTLLNPKTGGVFASFGAHPSFEIALERALTELLQGRSFEGLNDLARPTLNSFAVQEQNNLIDHFIDSTGVISWKFFSSQADFDFVEWNFSGTTQEEFNYLMNILKSLDKEVYIADFDELGAKATRILVPGFSEIYPAEDLIWDNHNHCIHYREEILNIHSLENGDLEKLVLKLEETQMDHYTLISEFIGVSFDENSTWGEMTLAELKALIYLALGKTQEAKDLTEILTHFSHHPSERNKFFQLLDTCLGIHLDETLELEHFKRNLTLMYGEELVKAALGSLKGEVRFYNLPQTNTSLQEVERHLKLLESYKKIHLARSNNAEKSRKPLHESTL